MTRRLFMPVLIIAWTSSVVMAQNGKVSGLVVEKATGQPLVGANVVILGTTSGASTDVDGRFVILNVSPGTYDIKATYIGYQQVTVDNIGVTAGLTAEVNFSLSTTSVEIQPVVIIAVRPLIEKSATNMTRIIKADEFTVLPVRGITNYLSLQPGVALINGVIYVRGGRSDEVGQLVDGADAKNAMGSGSLVTTIPEAVEEILVQAGGYSAEFGGANSGIVQQNLKTGRDNSTAFVQYETDDFGNYPGKKFLGTYSYGYRDFVAGYSGPVIAKNIRLFVAGENNFTRDYTPVFWQGADFGNQIDNGFRSGLKGDTTVAPLKWGDGNVPGRFFNRFTGNGTLLLDYSPILVRVSGSYTWSRQQINTAPITSIFDQGRLPNVDATNLFLNVKGTYLVSPKTFVELIVSTLSSTDKTYDPNFGDNFLAYADSSQGAAHGWRYVNGTTPPLDYASNGFFFSRPGALLTGYAKGQQGYIGVSGNITSQIQRHEVKAGFSYEYWTMRNYSIGGLSGLLTGIQSRPGIQNDQAAYLQFIRQTTNVLNYGYDELGNNLDSGPDGPKHPHFLSAYVQDKIEFDDLIINAGFRVDNIYMNSWKLLDPSNPLYNPTDLQLGNIADAPQVTFVEPRLGFSFPVSDQTMFHVQYGKFIQAPQLSLVFTGRHSAYQITGYNTPIANSLDPIQTVQYEIGFTQLFTEYASFDVSGFYKDVKGLVQQAHQQTIAGSPFPPYFIYVNSDFATTAGLEFSLRTRRTHRVLAQVNYTLSVAKGTNSFPASSYGALAQSTQSPTIVAPLTYDSPNRGSMWVDYRFDQGDGGSVLEGVGLNLLFTFNAGHRYTLATGGLGQQGSDGGGILNDFDPRNRVPIEPINSSTTPWVYSLDLGIDKTFKLSGVNLNVYIKATNLLNTQNVINVYYRTGNAYDDGFLTNSNLSSQIIAANGSQYIPFYRAINLGDRQHQWRYNGPDLFGAPRQIKLGARLEL